MSSSIATTPVFQRITTILDEKFGIPREDVTPDTVLDDIELDSLALIEVGLALQKQLGAQVRTEDLSGSATVADLYELVNTAVGGS
ncbi:acyl carrier protein [Streptomyces avicenniae]|uniref:acyl carrier protein n=1 Tax=Streptomyces avicenniae TaxID=500153 RepID=UPI00167E92F2|nr:acyl carrier protein [Streptomyces avicenniae]